MRGVPPVRDLLAAGASDRVFDAILVAGPVVVALVAVLGRGPVTHALVAGYLLSFVAYTLAKGVRRGTGDGT